jgi:hypothetical protein
MKHHITWTGYLEAVMLLLVVYYGYIFLKYYLKDLRSKRRRTAAPQAIEEAIPAELFNTSPDITNALKEDFEQQMPYQESQQAISDADQFLNRAKQAIDIAAKRPYSPERTIKELKEIAAAFPILKSSPYLSGIVEVISLKCEETGTATLSEDEICAWWEDQ